jgi:nickel-type superoxide dismutase maturation protease
MAIVRAFAGPLVVAGAAALVVRRWVDTVEVRGRSMAPALEPGDRLLVVRRRGPVRVGDVVLALDPRDASRELVKRVARVDEHGTELRGDHADSSTDARTFGTLPESAVTWRAIARYWPPGRLGRLDRSAPSEA